MGALVLALAICHYNHLSFLFRSTHAGPVDPAYYHSDKIRHQRRRDLQANRQILGQNLSDQLRHGRRHRYRAGVPVRSELVGNRSFRWAATCALVGSVLMATFGHFQGQFLIQHQPFKMAAAEALWETEEPTGFALVAGIDERVESWSRAIHLPAPAYYRIM